MTLQSRHHKSAETAQCSHADSAGCGVDIEWGIQKVGCETDWQSKRRSQRELPVEVGRGTPRCGCCRDVCRRRQVSIQLSEYCYFTAQLLQYPELRVHDTLDGEGTMEFWDVIKVAVSQVALRRL